jgi:hypothetical protein
MASDLGGAAVHCGTTAMFINRRADDDRKRQTANRVQQISKFHDFVF